MYVVQRGCERESNLVQFACPVFQQRQRCTDEREEVLTCSTMPLSWARGRGRERERLNGKNQSNHNMAPLSIFEGRETFYQIFSVYKRFELEETRVSFVYTITPAFLRNYPRCNPPLCCFLLQKWWGASSRGVGGWGTYTSPFTTSHRGKVGGGRTQLQARQSVQHPS